MATGGSAREVYESPDGSDSIDVGAIRSLARALTSKVARPSWMRAIVDSRLVDRKIAATELRRRFPDPDTWIRFVVDQSLVTPSTRDRALRALGTLVNDYTKDAKFNPRVRTAIRKARTACEQSDLERLARHVDSLRQLKESGDDPLLLHPEWLVFLAVPAPARVAMRAFIGRYQTPLPPGPLDDQIAEANGSTVARSGVHPMPAVERRTDIQDANAVDPMAALKAELQAVANGSTGQAWDIDHWAKHLELHLPTLPAFPVPPYGVTQARERALLIAEQLASLSAEASTPSELGPWFDACEALGQLAHATRSELEVSWAKTTESARAYARLLPATFQDRAQCALDGLPDGDVGASLAALLELGQKAMEESDQASRECVSVAKRVESLAGTLSLREHAEIKRRCIAAFESGLGAALTSLHRLADTTKSRASGASEKSCAADLLLHLDFANGACEAPEKVLARLRESGAEAALELASTLWHLGPRAALVSADTAEGLAAGGDAACLALALSANRFVVSLDGFSARNRFTANWFKQAISTPAAVGLGDTTFAPTSASAAEAVQIAAKLTSSDDAKMRSVGALNLLFWRAIEEADGGSVLGVLEHALDMLHLAARCDPVQDEWAALALSLLAVEGDPAADIPLSASVRQAIAVHGDVGLTGVLTELLRSASRDLLLAERYAVVDVQPFVATLASALFTAAGAQAEHRSIVMEDISRGLLIGLSHAGRSVSVELLQRLAVLDSVDQSLVDKLGSVLSGAAHQPLTSQAEPDWVSYVLGHVAAIPDRRVATTSTSQVHVQIPISVSRHGGFHVRPGAGEVNLALLVSRPATTPAVEVEIVIPARRNPRLVATDVTVRARSIWPRQQHVVPVRLDLTDDVTLPVPEARLQYQARWMDLTTGRVVAEDRSLTLSLTTEPAGPVRDYPHSDGRPLVLREDELKFSSRSVRDALTTIRSALLQGSLAARLVGRRRRGKTSILETIKCDEAIQTQYVILADAREDLPFRTFAEAMMQLGAVLDRLPRRLGLANAPRLAELLARPGAGWSEIQDWIETISSELAGGQVRALLIIDEFQKWISELDPESSVRTLSVFRGLFNRPPQARLSFSIILSGLTNIDVLAAHSTDFKVAFRSLKLREFSNRETDALIRSNESIEFDNRAIEIIRKLSGGNPFLVNLLGSLIAEALREAGRSYCLPEDVEGVVEEELRDEQSRVRSFVQYLLRKGEEDHAAQVDELPALVALAWALREHRGPYRLVSLERIRQGLRDADVAFDDRVLEEHLDSAVADELLVKDGARFGFAAEWLERWLRRMHDRPLSVTGVRDVDLVLNRYRVRELRATGGQAQVFEAEDTRTRRRVILKIYARPGGISSLALSEVEALSRVEHAGVVRCLDRGYDDRKGDVVVLERVEGKDLRSYLHSPPESARALIGPEGKIAKQMQFLAGLARAVAECHRAGVIHKDIKPENIMVREQDGIWLPVLIDFGLSPGGSTAPDQVSVALYTPGYVAPERYAGETRRAASDVYSLGVVAYELLCGAAPFPAERVNAEKAQRAGTYLAVRDVRPDVPERLGELIATMLDMDPAKRPDAAAVQRELPLSLENLNWRQLAHMGDQAYEDTDVADAVEHYERAIFSASLEDRRSPDYVRMLSRFLEALELHDAARKIELLPRVAKLAADVVVHGEDERGGHLLVHLSKVATTLGCPDEQTRRARQEVLVQVLTVIQDSAPKAAAVPYLEHALQSLADPVFWQSADDIFLESSRAVAARLMSPGLLISECILVSERMRTTDQSLGLCQVWLRRAARLGAIDSPEFRQEDEAVERLLRRTVTPLRLPPNAAEQASPESTVGESEKAHLNVDRIQAWVTRLLRLHPYVEAVRRVRKDPGMPPHATRLLDLQNLGQHTIAGSEHDASRFVPAVLDGTYSRPPGVALRINIILPKDTTEAQRAAAMDELGRDRRLFGG